VACDFTRFYANEIVRIEKWGNWNLFNSL